MGRISIRRALRTSAGAAAIALASIVAMALPASAQAARFDLGITQEASAKVVDRGATATYTITVTNLGSEPYESVYVNIFSLKGEGLGAANPYRSATTTQGTCPDQSVGAYHQLVCTLGPLASGASVRIVAVVEVNESMNQIAALLPNPYEGGFIDDNNANNEAVVRTTASVPPTVSGSKKIKLSGLPTGCAPGDFILRAKATVKGVKKMRASLYLGLNTEGEGGTWEKTVRGDHLRVKVPASRLAPELGVFYKLKVKAKRGGAKPLTTTVTFQPC
ncbi:MAG: hypothetical protein QOF23_1948 [Solirubrobacterales bacterium]|jgi:hypothetical protein|nr:hypothetical protein [Solirubrobacterales bacterium]